MPIIYSYFRSVNNLFALWCAFVRYQTICFSLQLIAARYAACLSNILFAGGFYV